jgi:hypothetical protein
LGFSGKALQFGLSRRATVCAETISRAAKVTASTRFSLPLVTTSACYCAGLGDPLRLKSRASFNAIPILLLSQKRMQARQAKRDHSNGFVKKEGCKEKNK